MQYNSNIEDYETYSNFSRNDPCIWIVYPAGASGDLLASIINFHYARTGAEFFGIDDTGRVIFRSSDNKYSNWEFHNNANYDPGQGLIDGVYTTLLNKKLNYRLTDQIIFSNHAYKNNQIEKIVNFFPKSKIIRILPKTNLEQEIINWLCVYKNTNTIKEFIRPNSIIVEPDLTTAHTQVLDIFFSDLLSEKTFEATYDKIVQHLNLDYKLVRYDFVNYWHTRQHPAITSLLAEIINK
jgi:hypothetical protein